MIEVGDGQLKERTKGRTPKKPKKTRFLRQESWRYKRLEESWRRPKGIDNKMRRRKKGWPATVNIGYRSPRDSRRLHPSGYEEILIHSVKQAREADPEKQVLRIGHTVGRRKRRRLILEAKRRKLTVLNSGEPAEEVRRERTESGNRTRSSRTHSKGEDREVD